MTNQLKHVAFAVGLLVTLNCQLSTVFAQGTAFTYQGRLTENNTPFTGNAEFQVTLWDAANGGAVVASNSPAAVIVGVTNGLFVLPLDFGLNFPGAARWIQLEVRTTIGPFSSLTPRQAITATPYATTAKNLSGTLPAGQLNGTLNSASLAGTYGAVLNFTNAANRFAGNGADLTALDASQLTSGTVPDVRLAVNVARTNQVWQLGGNAGTTPSTAYLGTTDNNQPLNFIVGSRRVLRLERGGPGDTPNIIAGSSANSASTGVKGATIAGGGGADFVDLFPNRVTADFGTVGGGNNNEASGFGATVSGGLNNIANGYASTALGAWARASHDGSFVWADLQPWNPFESTAANQFAIRASGGFFLDGKLGIGLSSPTYSLDVQGSQAVGRLTTTNNANGAVLVLKNTSTSPSYLGAINFEDSAGTPGQIGYLANGQMAFRAGSQPRMTLDDTGLTVNGTFVSASDRSIKQDFAAVDAQEVLEKVAALPLRNWSYTNRPGVKHVGPMAQDFHAAFGLGEDDKHIATVDADGVALAAIQGLNQKLQDRSQRSDDRIQKLEAQNAELRKELNAIKTILDELTHAKH
jgi:hypothetical protein